MVAGVQNVFEFIISHHENFVLNIYDCKLLYKACPFLKFTSKMKREFFYLHHKLVINIQRKD